MWAGYAGVSYETSSASELETQAERLLRELRHKRRTRDTARDLEEDAYSPRSTQHRASIAQGLKAYVSGLAALSDFDAHKKWVWRRRPPPFFFPLYLPLLL